jgi:DNA-directed RNA polymerase III subunit RPC2
MGMESDQEIVQLVGAEETFFSGLSPSLEESTKHKIFTQVQALEYLGGQIKAVTKKPTTSRGRTKVKIAVTFLLIGKG